MLGFIESQDFLLTGLGRTHPFRAENKIAGFSIEARSARRHWHSAWQQRESRTQKGHTWSKTTTDKPKLKEFYKILSKNVKIMRNCHRLEETMEKKEENAVWKLDTILKQQQKDISLKTGEMQIMSIVNTIVSKAFLAWELCYSHVKCLHREIQC